MAILPMILPLKVGDDRSVTGSDSVETASKRSRQTPGNVDVDGRRC